MRLLKSLFIAFSAAALLTACGAGGDNQGREYAPNMYHSVAYDPLTQITDEDAGRIVTSIEYPDGHAEFYNSNKLNPHHMKHAHAACQYGKEKCTGMVAISYYERQS